MPGEVDAGRVLFECEKSAMGLSRSEKLDMIVYVDPENYYNMDYKDKYSIANAIGTINWKMRDSGKKILLMVPGRLGTTSPELSYGSHFFQDLVESGILYNSIFENEKTKIFNIELLAGCKNILEEFDSKYEKLGEIIHIYDVSDKGFMLCNDMRKERIICFKNLQ